MQAGYCELIGVMQIILYFACLIREGGPALYMSAPKSFSGSVMIERPSSVASVTCGNISKELGCQSPLLSL